MASIFDIAEDRKNLFKLLEENDWDVSAIQDTLAGDGFDDKLNDWLRVIVNAESMAESLKTEADTLAARKKQYDNQAKNMKKALHQVLVNLDIKTHKVMMGTLSRSDVKPAIKFDESKLDSDYVILDTVRSPDKQKIESDMNAGVEVPGAYYEMQPERFSIRRK